MSKKKKAGMLKTIIRNLHPEKPESEGLSEDIMNTLLHALEDIDEELNAHYKTHKNTKNES